MLVRPVNEMLLIKTNKKENKMKHNQTAKKKAVHRLTTLMKNGVALGDARAVVASEYKVTPTTIAKWQTSSKTIKTTDLIANPGTLHQSTSLMVKSSNGAIKGLESMKNQLGIVFTSLVNQDGRFTNPDATAISGTANVVLGFCRQILLERKAINKVTKTEDLI